MMTDREANEVCQYTIVQIDRSRAMRTWHIEGLAGQLYIKIGCTKRGFGPAQYCWIKPAQHGEPSEFRWITRGEARNIFGVCRR